MRLERASMKSKYERVSMMKYIEVSMKTSMKNATLKELV